MILWCGGAFTGTSNEKDGLAMEDRSVLMIVEL